jgi:hypothetical protein
LNEEQTCPAREWVRNTLLDYFTLFKWGYLPLTDQVEGDMMRRVWRSIDTVFDDSKIMCRGWVQDVLLASFYFMIIYFFLLHNEELKNQADHHQLVYIRIEP